MDKKEKMLKRATQILNEAFDSEEPIILTTNTKTGTNIFSVGNQWQIRSLVLSCAVHILTGYYPEYDIDEGKLFNDLNDVFKKYLGVSGNDK